MNTDHNVQDNQMQTNLVFELMDFEIWKHTGFLERSQVKDNFKDRSASLALRVSCPDLRQDRGSDCSNNGSGVPVVLVQESAEGTRAFDWSVFRSGITVGFKERGDQGVEGLKLVVGGDEGLNGVEYGSGFFVHRTISLLVGT